MQTDLFGQQVALTFRGKDMFHTKIGCAATWCLLVFFSIITMMKITEFSLQSSELFMVTQTPYRDEFIDLGAYNFMFAVQNVDETVGRLVVSLNDNSIKDGKALGESIKHPIEMMNCEDKINQRLEVLQTLELKEHLTVQ